MENYFEDIQERIKFIEDYMLDISEKVGTFLSGEENYTPEEADFWCDEFDEVHLEWEKLVIQRSMLFN
jgi:hypothetical protein